MRKKNVQNDIFSWQSLVAVLHNCVSIMLECINMQNIPSCSIVMNSFTKRPQTAKLIIGKPLSPFCIPMAIDIFKIGKFATFYPNIPCGARVLSIFTY